MDTTKEIQDVIDRLSEGKYMEGFNDGLVLAHHLLLFSPAAIREKAIDSIHRAKVVASGKAPGLHVSWCRLCGDDHCTFYTPRCEESQKQKARAIAAGMPPSGRHG